MVTCDICGVELSKTPCQGHERRTKIDSVFEKVVEHIDAEIKQCPNCEATVFVGPTCYVNLRLLLTQTNIGGLAT